MWGGGNLIDKVDPSFRRIGVDINEYLIEMWKALLNGWIPPDFVSEEDWKDVRENMDSKYPKYYIGFVRLCCSFGADWNGGYARNVRKGLPNSEVLNSTTKSYCKQSKCNILKQLPKLIGVEFIHGDYTAVSQITGSLIYCDPPYKGTTQYKDLFEYERFYEWCREMAKSNIVYVSEYQMPNDFIVVWEGVQKTNISSSRVSGVEVTEKLFRMG